MSVHKTAALGLVVAWLIVAQPVAPAEAALILTTNQANYGSFQPGDTFNVEVFLSQSAAPPILLGTFLLELASITLEVDGPHQIVGFTPSSDFPVNGTATTGTTPTTSLDVFLSDLPGTVAIPGVGDPGLSLGVFTIQTAALGGIFSLRVREFDETPNSFDFAAVDANNSNNVLVFDPTASPSASFEVVIVPQDNGVPEPGTLVLAGLVTVAGWGWRWIHSGSSGCNSGARKRPSTRMG
ncbi:hypothetical protein Isop_0977 [Isosphaera pallida ATCC 43644]|uniref:Ice-binding protein C-terminal domain-containing protein n=1 Tax=Isosphaera pallida (strain ATCC 43644 / DSM 9630 / IS1B) TaxID=575540 RepID=E8R3J9_ISOPI|nr:PEP-CTERM sorting domain-containing protein [Isosphaera pallida]ADV61566.1 hypothetical protein Isop_0977 [Isosphaera pallida ATCC 43644]